MSDNTCTNATWAAVSFIPLAQILEREFFVRLFVSQNAYEGWGRLLKSLIEARARAAGDAPPRRPAPSCSRSPPFLHRDSTTRRLTQAPQTRERERGEQRGERWGGGTESNDGGGG
ncbi:hypothetical protein B0H16DRAFT_132411 [Mycena metata]|uniref:Uncharacterized protein n=1 Tax=Mycena metata TaxID=1033252 RepID=A0AAD7I5E0_9AGAR|nr:hypothetical protein B0H16DRAFT_132411 [Mycena metata]